MDRFLDEGAEALLESLFATFSWCLSLESHVRLFLFRVTSSIAPNLLSFYFYSEVLKDEHLVQV